MTRNVTDIQFGAQGQYAGREATPYYTQHDFDGPAKLSTTVVHAVADVAGAEMTETESTLFQHVDPDSLDDLFSPAGPNAPRTNGHVSFTVWGHEVTVYSNGRIVIVPPQHPR